MSKGKGSKKEQTPKVEVEQPAVTPASLGITKPLAGIRKGVLMRVRDISRECGRDVIAAEMEAQALLLDNNLPLEVSTMTEGQLNSLIGLGDALVAVAKQWTDKHVDKCTRVEVASDMARTLRLIKSGEKKAMSTEEVAAAQAEVDELNVAMAALLEKKAKADAKLAV